MRPIGESAEVFEAYARIDYCYYMLQEIANEKPEQLSPIEIMIDRASGYGKAKQQETFETAKSLLEEIISSKKIIEADYSKDQIALSKLLQLNTES